MSAIKIDADALFRAVTATGYKLLAYNLDLDTGAITSRTMRPDEVADAAQGPSVKPLPKMGGDLAPKKDASPFGPLPVASKKGLFGDEDLPKKQSFNSDFWKRDDNNKKDIFGDGGFKRESGSKKLAEIFGEGPAKKKIDPFAKPAEAPAASAPTPAAPVPATAANSPSVPPEDPRKPRIPAASEEQHAEWMRAFALQFGDPQIRDELLAALKTAKPSAAWERVTRKHQRMGQQWERYYRKVALEFGELWISEFRIAWELVENEVRP